MTDVPFCRVLRRGTVGGDVVAHKRALSRWNPSVYGWHEFTPLYGPFFEKAVRTFQKARGLKVDGVIGTATHEALERLLNAHDDPVFDRYAVKLATDYCARFAKTPDQRVREAIVASAFFWLSHASSIAYGHVRPWPQGKPPFVPREWDCSALVSVCHFAGGAPDPNGLGHRREGYTGTLQNHGRRVGVVEELLPGDMIFYGHSAGGVPGFNPGDPTHVALYVGVFKGVHSVISNGHHPMGLYRWNYRTDINHLRHYTVSGV